MSQCQVCSAQKLKGLSNLWCSLGTGSPFSVVVGADMEKISVSGAAVNFASIEQSAVITVHNIPNERDLFVKIESPNGQTIPATLKQESHSTNVTVEFFPRIPGEHLIHLNYKGSPLPGSPFPSKVYDIKQIVVKEMPNEIFVGKPVTFLGETRSLECLPTYHFCSHTLLHHDQ